MEADDAEILRVRLGENQAEMQFISEQFNSVFGRLLGASFGAKELT